MMRIKPFCYFLAFIAISFTSFSQDRLTQNVFGVVLDRHSQTPVEGANVILKGGEYNNGASTDANGKFRIADVPLGRYTLTISHVGYELLQLKDQLIESGKEKHFLLELKSSLNQLEEVTISEHGNSSFELQNISSYTFSQEQNQRFAATFYDPGRMALSFPGVTTTSDQANNISVRGNAPYTNRWRLEGADIVNPNHLTNAGTFTDRISVTGGGVNILSAQLMSDARLMTGAYPARYGDALGGILDINLRRGNPNNREHTVQVGLLGIDLSTEGPLNKNSGSYLVNYRYSTIGLLQSMGVEISDETINFQDLSFHIALPGKKSIEWSVFGLIGLSSEKFSAEQDSSLWENEENRVSTNFTSNMGAMGITNKINLKRNTSLRTVAAVSAIQTEREASFMDESYTSVPYQNDRYDHGMFTINSTLSHKTKKGNGLSAGLIYNRVFFDLLSEEDLSLNGNFSRLMGSTGGYNVFKAFGEWSANLGSDFRTQVGLHTLYFDLNDNISLEPRAAIEYFASSRSTFSLSYGLTSQSHFPQVYFVTDEEQNYPNRSLDLARSHQLNISYAYNINPFTLIKLESYYQKHFNVPISSDPSSSFSLLNAVDAFIGEELVNEGEGENKGVELLLNRSFRNGYYFLLSSALFDSRYTSPDGTKRSTRYDGDYAFSFTGGKEFQLLNKGKNRLFGINVRAFWQGGYRHTPIDIEASHAAGKTVFIESEAFSLQYKDFFRTDLRLYFKKNKENYTRTLSFDIQNLTNQKNIGFEYYDTYLDKIVTKEQLGLIPFITYRIEF